MVPGLRANAHVGGTTSAVPLFGRKENLSSEPRSILAMRRRLERAGGPLHGTRYTALRSCVALSDERSDAGPTVQVVQARVMSLRRARRRSSKVSQRDP